MRNLVGILGICGVILSGSLRVHADDAPAAMIEVRWYGSYDPAWGEAEWRTKADAMSRHIRLTTELGIKPGHFLMPAEVEYLSQHAPDIIQSLKKAGVAIGHHNTDGPPNLSPVRLLKGKSWDDDVRAVLDFETHKVNPLTGEIMQNQVGGLSLMTLLFGPQTVATGRFRRAPVLMAAKQAGLRACRGLTEDLGASRGDVWFMGMISVPDGLVVDFAQQIVPCALGGAPDPLGAALPTVQKMTPSPFRRVTVVLRDKDFLAPRSEQEQERLWASYGRLLQAAVSKSFKPVSIADILDTIQDDGEKRVPLSVLDQAVKCYIDACSQSSPEGMSPPSFIELKGDCLSLSDLYQMAQNVLAWWRMSRVISDSATSPDILGPTAYGPSLSGRTNVNLNDVADAAREALPTTLTQVPNAIKVGGVQMNPAEFLYLMCRAYQQIRKKPAEELGSDQAIPIAVLPADVRRSSKADPLTKLQFWTLKPVRWK